MKTNQISKNPCLQSSIIVMICVCFIMIVLPSPIFETNDDVGMLLIASGRVLTSTPDGHIIFSNYLLGTLFRLLYENWPHYPWYGIFHITTILVCAFFLNYIFAVRHRGENFFLRIILTIVCFLPFVLVLQFTKTAFILGMTGFLIIYLACHIDFQHTVVKLTFYIFAPTFLFFSFLVRKESFVLATIICIIFILASIVKKPWPTSLTLTLTFLLIMFGVFCHSINYKGEWEYYSSLQRDVSRLTDYREIDFDKNVTIFNNVCWSKNDFLTIQSWGHIDPTVYNAEKIKYVLTSTTKDKLESMEKILLKGFKPKYTKKYIFTVLILFLFMLICMPKNIQINALLFSLLPFLLCIFLLVWNGRITPWVSASMVCFLPWSTLAIAGHSEIKCHKPLKRFLAITFLLLVFVFSVDQIKYLTKIGKRHLSLNKTIKEFSLRSSVFVCWGGAFPFEGIMPLESVEYLNNVKIIFLSTLNQSPIQNNLLRELEIKELFYDLINRENINIAISDVTKPIFFDYMKEHYGKDVGLKSVYNKKGIIMYEVVVKADKI